MPGKRVASNGWGPLSMAMLSAASVAVVVWIAVGAAMLFGVRTAPPPDPAAEQDGPKISGAPEATTSGPGGYSPSTYDGPLPTRKPKKAPTATAHPEQSPTATATTAAPAPTSSPTGGPGPPEPSPTDDDNPGKAKGHTKGPR